MQYKNTGEEGEEERRGVEKSERGREGKEKGRGVCVHVCERVCDVITEASFYLCTGHPLPSDIKQIMHSLLNGHARGHVRVRAGQPDGTRACVD